MPAPSSPATRFREFRERAGLSHEEAARRMGITTPSVHDIENIEEELSTAYSPEQGQHFCHVLGFQPRDLFAIESTVQPVSGAALVSLIHEQYRSRGITLEQFEDAVGWRLKACLDSPEHLLEEITIDGLKSLCHELGIPWQGVIAGL